LRHVPQLLGYVPQLLRHAPQLLCHVPQRFWYAPQLLCRVPHKNCGKNLFFIRVCPCLCVCPWQKGFKFSACS
jgi:hypothetical protein